MVKLSPWPRDDIISKADKGSAVVIPEVDKYIQEAERQLNDAEFYERKNQDLTAALTDTINNTIEQFAKAKLIPEKNSQSSEGRRSENSQILHATKGT